MEHEGHRERMRARFAKSGLEGFADHEVLELLLFYAIPRRNTNLEAHSLLKRFGSLHAVLDADVKSLKQVEGVGEGAATLITLFSQVARRLDMSRRAERREIKTRGQAQNHCLALLSGLRQEHFYVVGLSGQMKHLGDVLIARGSLSDVPAYPRLVAEAVLGLNAHSVVLCHNHPGGSLVPSRRDVEVTRQLNALLDGLSVALADHIVVAGGEALSMVACGLIEQRATDAGVLTQVADPGGEMLIRERLGNMLKGTKGDP